MTDIAVVDYGMGNLRSVAKALTHVAPERSIVVTADPAVIRAAAHVVLPGQSAMPDCIALPRRSGLREVVLEAARDAPVPRHLPRPADAVRRERGGAHAVPRASSRAASCASATRRWRSRGGERLKVPHMGWSPVRQARPHPLWAGIADGTRFYFAHSYHPEPADPAVIAGTTDYPLPFTCAIARANIFATQFHPEKSQRAGLQLLANFVVWDGTS